MFCRTIRACVGEDESSWLYIIVLLTWMLLLFCYCYIMQLVLDSSLKNRYFDSEGRRAFHLSSL